MALLSVKNATMQFGGLTAVSDFNLEINEGEIVSLIGPNGAGKTTAFNMITNVYTPTKGKVIFDGIDITGMRQDKITQTGIARTFQNIRLFKDLTVLDNVLIANHVHIKSNCFEAMLKLPKYRKEEKEMVKKSLELLKELGLEDLKDEKASSLPYGKQRKLEIARALATNPKLLLLDEPAAGMNPTETDELTAFVKEIKEKFNLSIFMIEHHMNMVMSLSDRIQVFEYGITIAKGTPSEIQNDKKVIEAYLGVSEDD
ncbi:ABC transporter ATP-binding protein [Clostridium saccharobutylicum]|uniref:High-affinity branched-chain amino acid transport ATP-binding protein BraF n=3 Tax=Clostridium saccharobutylicum TaxID=169679 RepID=U5MXD7_CLOSA|nr:ABC transporter ATP-binding protein [Clostridium saccharobutylicum]AGX44291.1 high-affinity branched-chain amino acid transport ATP-binding protein BraF [Clostridium saccharobutylicum DSM 13864]AQR91580.1 lipopolysaccharide export system ATP-binding protein LptB [Clostridium saccharobutylicum]AQS01485.1 lipopolysaccharide export system ATP-binding protein LptB [Clostridium saccharobutylicum]AQS15468.1 lipopolysaccharide export system ATP-binding protein LptB [Clostridium saccharobutylicum]M